MNLVELRQLAYFEAVARDGGFTAAARRLHVAQSAVSAQIRALEAELGAALFARTTRRVSLTQAGELLLARADRVRAELAGARAEIAELGAVVRGRVTLGATAVLGRYDLPAALAAFHAAYPGVELALRTGLIAELLAGLDAGETDLVVGPVHADRPERFTARRLVAERLVVALPPGHRAAATPGPVPLAALRDEAFVCLAASSGLRRLLDDAAAAAGFTARVPFETFSAASVRELVAAGLGVALLAESAAAGPGPAIVVRPSDPPVPHPPIGVLHHRSRRLSPAARACRRYLLAADLPEGA